MTGTVSISLLSQHAGSSVTIRGWLAAQRSGGKVVFLQVRDGSGICQCVVEAAQADAFSACASLQQECSLEIGGVPRIDERAPGGVEVAVASLRLVQGREGYPITRKAHGTDFLMQHRHLWLRSPRQAAILKIRHTLVNAARDFFNQRDFTLIDTPILTPGAAEGAGTLFPVDFFGDEVYLAQTGQLYLEAAAMALGKVYCFGPTFRAEKSKTRRHLTEFWMIEPEAAYYELPDLVLLAQDFISHLVAAALAANRPELALLGRDTTPLEKIAPPFPRITYSEAVEILRSDDVQATLQREQEDEAALLATLQQQFQSLESEHAKTSKVWKQDQLARQIADLREQIRDTEASLENRPLHMRQARDFEWGKDLGGAEETILSRRYEKPLIVTEYPREAKAFYMKRSPSDPRTVLNLDVLAPEGYGEIIGGSQREDDLDALAARMAEEGLDPAPYEWFLDLRRYGSVPHGGFGLGIERTIAWICGLKHIRETIPFPRLMGRIYP